MDAWVLDPAKLAGMNVAHWLPVDCQPLAAMDRKVLDACGGRPIAISEFGRRQLRDAGVRPAVCAAQPGHGGVVAAEDRQAARESLGFGDRFIIGINAANQDPMRKGYGEQIEAFARFARKHPDALLLIHARAETRQGADLQAIVAHHGSPGRSFSATST